MDRCFHNNLLFWSFDLWHGAFQMNYLESIELVLSQYKCSIMHNLKIGNMKQARKLSNIMESLVPTNDEVSLP